MWKNVLLAALSNLKIETVVQSFIKNVFSFYEAPSAIVSDQSSQFISEFWIRFCKILNIQCQLSTVFHPQTNESTERMNSIIKSMLRAFSNWDQMNWAPLLSIIQVMIKNHIVFLTKIFSFFLLHDYELDTIQVEQNSEARSRRNPDSKSPKF